MDQLKKFKIFIVDDEILYLNILEQYIRNIGIDDISTFNNGTECLDHLHENPDVVFLDYNMDTFNGYDILKKIKRINPNVYVVIVSGQARIKLAVDTLKHGAFDYIVKGDDVENKAKDIFRRIQTLNNILARTKPSFLKKLLLFL